VNHGWQSESTDGPKGGWSCVFLEWLQSLQRSPHSQLLDVVWCSAEVVVAVGSCSCSCSGVDVVEVVMW